MRAELHSLIINSLFHSVISVHFPLRRADLGLKERSSLDEYRMIRKHGGVIKIEINSLNRGSVNDNQPYSGDRTIPFFVSLFLFPYTQLIIFIYYHNNQPINVFKSY